MTDAELLAALEAEQAMPMLNIDYGKIVDVVMYYSKQRQWADAEAEVRKIVETAFYRTIKESK